MQRLETKIIYFLWHFCPLCSNQPIVIGSGGDSWTSQNANIILDSKNWSNLISQTYPSQEKYISPTYPYFFFHFFFVVAAEIASHWTHMPYMFHQLAQCLKENHTSFSSFGIGLLFYPAIWVVLLIGQYGGELTKPPILEYMLFLPWPHNVNMPFCFCISRSGLPSGPSNATFMAL